MISLINLIKNRRSIRKYTDKKIPDKELRQILEAGIWAPSGLNNQPWRFAVITDIDVRERISQWTKYAQIIVNSTCCIAVFYNHSAGYNRDKDIMSIGACIQNMLLYASSIGIGCVWLGEILSNKDEINSILGIGDDNELMAMIAMGYPDEDGKSTRKKLEDFIIY